MPIFLNGLPCVSPGMQRAFAAAIGIEDSAQGRPLPDREAAERHYEPLRREAEAILASRTTADQFFKK